MIRSTRPKTALFVLTSKKGNEKVLSFGKSSLKTFFSVKVLLRGYPVVASMMAFATVVTAVMNGQATNLYSKLWTKGIKKSYINSKHHAMIDVILENKMF